MSADRVTHYEHVDVSLIIQSGPNRDRPQLGRFVCRAEFPGGLASGMTAWAGGGNPEVAVQRAVRSLMEQKP